MEWIFKCRGCDLPTACQLYYVCDDYSEYRCRQCWRGLAVAQWKPHIGFTLRRAARVRRNRRPG